MRWVRLCLMPSACLLMAGSGLLGGLNAVPADADAPSPATVSLQPSDVPGFSPIDSSIETMQDPNDEGFDQSFISCAGTDPLLSQFDSGSAVTVSSFYGQGQDQFGTPILSVATAVFSDGSAADAQTAFGNLTSSTFQSCWASTSDSLNTQQGITVPAMPTTVSTLSATNLGLTSAAFALNVDYSVEGTDVTGQLGATVMESGPIVTMLITLAYGEDFPDSARLGIAQLIAARMGATAPTPSPTPTPSPSPNPSCPTVAIYGVRGSAQDYTKADSGMGPEVAKLASEIKDRLPASDTVLTVGVPYPAASPLGAIFNSSDHDLSPYNVSVIEGADLLLNGRSDFTDPDQLLKRCPQTQLVLAGISQGAQVITTALADSASSSLIRKLTAAVILFASPVRVTGEAINIGAQNEDGVLTNPGSSQPGGHPSLVPKDMWSRTQSYCLQDDPICDNTNVGLLSPVLPPPNNIVNKRPTIHSSYAESLFELQGASFAASKILSALNQPSNFAKPFENYVALGDSYSAGEGTNDYFAGTHNGDDSCHRSSLSWTSLLGVPKSNFRACSGATINDLESGYKTESSQLSSLNLDTDLVTLTVGGDDLGFSTVLNDCTDIPAIHSESDSTCFSAISNATSQLPTVKAHLESLLQQIEFDAPSARVIVVGYPRLWPNGGYSGGCNWINQNRQVALNQADQALDTMLQQVATTEQDQFVSTWNAFSGHEVCGDKDGYVNDLQIHCPGGNGSQSFATCSESYHPTVEGYLAIRHLVFAQIDTDLRPDQPEPASTSPTTKAAAALSQVEAGYGSNVIESGILQAGTRKIAAIAYGSEERIDLWSFENDGWHKDATLDPKAGGVTATGIQSPGHCGACFQTEHLTGSVVDILAPIIFADQLGESVVAITNSSQTLVPFDTPGQSPTLWVPSAVVKNGQLASSSNNCDPDCAQGTFTKTTWQYSKSKMAFVPSK